MSLPGNNPQVGEPASDAIRTMLHAMVDQLLAERRRDQTEQAADLREVARAVYQTRRARNKILPRELLGEPAWDILLDLYGNDADQRGASTKRVCLAADVPYSTAWRCLAALEADGLVERFGDNLDARRQLVRLTERGEAAVRQCVGVAAGLALC
ncbi:MarR family transcriptional regulator [Novosphingobium piscinae]|uniref:MarR family transcriptional regulator n=1 Tax=Novosphingobium piscinae TaxID=1507448 RepID=A0A7X1KQ30_9SPHN|nr:MarR family transcriptional regulator [Novosphingobium piscinae]MBC2669344.1 MarR family transcriptional regulator [Novosphingobium piscinae]